MTDQELITLLRKRIQTLETAFQDWLDVMYETGKQRETAHNAVLAAMTTTFAEALLQDPDVTDEQRAHWLGTKPEASA